MAPFRSHRGRRLAVVGLAVVGATYIAVHIVANAQLRRLLPKAVAEAIGGHDADRYSVRIGGVRLLPLFDGVTAYELAVTFDSTVAGPVREPAIVREARLGSIRISGVRLIPLLRGTEIGVSSIDIVEPTVVLEYVAPPGEASSDAGAESDAIYDVSSVPAAALGRLRIRDGSVDLTRATDYGMLSSSVRGLDLELTEARFDSIAFANPARAFTNSSVSIAFDTLRHMFDDSLYLIRATDLRIDSRDSVVELGSVRISPTLQAATFFDRLPERADRIDLLAGPVRIRGLDFRRYVREGSVRVRSVAVDSMNLQVYSDISLDWGSRARACTYHMGFTAIEFPLRIDSVVVRNAFIRYSELAKGSERAGALTLESVNGTIVNVTNDPSHMTRETPAVVTARARLFGEAPMEARLEYPLLSPTLDFRFEGAVGPMALETVNRFATNVTGLEVTRGGLDSLWIETDVENGHARGTVHMLYRDLGFRLVNKNSGVEMPWHTLAGFAGNLIIRSNNPSQPHATPREGRIDYRCGEDHIVFFEFLVDLLTNGLKRIAI